jgi:hypothetical protein
MWTRKNSIRSRTKRTRRKRSKFITPDLSLVHGQLLHFVAGPDDPLSEAERVCGEFAEMVEDHHAAVRQFLQRAYGVAVQLRRRPIEFERLQVHPFFKQSGQKPRDRTRSKWVLYLLMQATTPNERHLANKYAVILDGLKQDQVEITAVAARIQELGGVGAAYEAMRARTTRLESRVTRDSQNKRTRPKALKSKQPARPTIPTAKQEPDGKGALKPKGRNSGTVKDQASGAEAFRPSYPRCRTRGIEASSPDYALRVGGCAVNS